MSVSMTTDAVYGRTKTVTRRHPDTWQDLAPGERLTLIEKGMGLIVPGFIPSPIGEVTEYHPTIFEWMMVLGIWAFGFFILTILLKGAIGILLGDIKYGSAQAVAAK